MSEKLRSAEDVANETIFDVDIAKALQGDYIAAFRHAIEADRLAVAEAVREACIHALESSVVVGRMRTQEQEDYSDAIDIACSFIRALDLDEILKG